MPYRSAFLLGVAGAAIGFAASYLIEKINEHNVYIKELLDILDNRVAYLIDLNNELEGKILELEKNTN